jgi:L-cysteine desulfidase
MIERIVVKKNLDVHVSHAGGRSERRLNLANANAHSELRKLFNEKRVLFGGAVVVHAKGVVVPEEIGKVYKEFGVRPASIMELLGAQTVGRPRGTTKRR